MDLHEDSSESREDGYTTEDDINLNAFFNEGPDLKITEFEHRNFVEDGGLVDSIETNNLVEVDQTNNILPDHQV